MLIELVSQCYKDRRLSHIYKIYLFQKKYFFQKIEVLDRLNN
jgi:hypothetical protein